MHIKIKNEFLLINTLSAILIIVIYTFDIQALRIALGLPFIFFCPGYALIAALYPKKSALSPIEKVALSLGLSFAVVILTGFIINRVWEIDLIPTLVSVSCFTFLMSGIAWYRRSKIPSEEKTVLNVNISLPKSINTKSNRFITIMLILSIAGAIASLIYAVTNEKTSQRFTEFYILNESGESKNYPVDLVTGEEGQVLVGIKNKEHSKITYVVNMEVGGVLTKTTEPIELADGQEWQEEITFTPTDSYVATTLASDIILDGKTNVRFDITSVQDLYVGDYIRIDQEVAQIQAIADHTISIESPLKQPHLKGLEIIKAQKIEFVLTKTRILNDSAGNPTSFSSWLEGDQLNFKVINLGQNQANYTIKMKTKSEQNTENREITPILVDAGKTWQNTVSANASESWSYTTELTLLKNQEVLDRGKTYDYYQTLRLLVAVH